MNKNYVESASGVFALGSKLRRGQMSDDARQLFLEKVAEMPIPSTVNAGVMTKSYALPTA